VKRRPTCFRGTSGPYRSIRAGWFRSHSRAPPWAEAAAMLFRLLAGGLKQPLEKAEQPPTLSRQAGGRPSSRADEQNNALWVVRRPEGRMRGPR